MFADPAGYETRQWAVLLALYTGARSSSEIARIKLAYIYEEQGVQVINLSGASKNIQSKRLVPIHHDLIKLGLLDYAKGLAATGQARLFPDWEPEYKVNRWFLRTFLPRLGIDDERIHAGAQGNVDVTTSTIVDADLMDVFHRAPASRGAKSPTEGPRQETRSRDHFRDRVVGCVVIRDPLL